MSRVRVSNAPDGWKIEEPGVATARYQRGTGWEARPIGDMLPVTTDLFVPYKGNGRKPLSLHPDRCLGQMATGGVCNLRKGHRDHCKYRVAA